MNRPPVDMVTAQGHGVWFNNPSWTTVDPLDIRTHTMNMCRYNGALHWPLVKHLALCVKLVTYTKQRPSERQRILQSGYAAAHDFHEIIVGDVVSGLKKHIPEYCKLETMWEEYFHETLGLPLKYKDVARVTSVDQRALVIEMDQLNHPAAQLVANKYGGSPSANERIAFAAIQKASLEECWETVWSAVIEARAMLLIEEQS